MNYSYEPKTDHSYNAEKKIKYRNLKARTNVKISQFDDKGAHCSNKTTEH